MQRKKVLWLVSWYPNLNDRFDGDFIQRHARAAAIHHDIHVLFVTSADIDKEFEEKRLQLPGITEQIIYYNLSDTPFKSIQKQWRWRRFMKKAVSGYIRDHGLPDHLHVHVAWKAGLTALALQKKYGLRYFITEHWGMYSNQVAESIFTKPVIVRSLISKILQKADKVQAVSHYLAGVIGKFSGRSDIRVIPNLVDTRLFYPMMEKHQTFTFIHVSNMAPVKNITGILEAFGNLLSRHAVPAQMVFVGNRNDVYEKKAAQMGLPVGSVFFRGEVPYTSVADEMRKAHCLVMFSESETFSCVAAEALCCGLPVILTDTAALPELMDDNNGILVPVGDTGALTKAMLQVFTEYGSYDSKTISDNATRKYSIETIARKFDELYR